VNAEIRNDLVTVPLAAGAVKLDSSPRRRKAVVATFWTAIPAETQEKERRTVRNVHPTVAPTVTARDRGRRNRGREFRRVGSVPFPILLDQCSNGSPVSDCPDLAHTMEEGPDRPHIQRCGDEYESCDVRDTAFHEYVTADGGEELRRPTERAFSRVALQMAEYLKVLTR